MTFISPHEEPQGSISCQQGNRFCQKGNQPSYALCIFMIYVFIGCTHHLTTSGYFYMFHRQKADTAIVDYEVERYQQNNIHKSQSTS